MAKVLKAQGLRLKEASPEADLALINRYSVRELTPEEVFCFSVVMCDNDIDRDLDQFTDETLESLAPMFEGRTVISDHSWSAGNQIGRIYAAEVRQTAEKNEAGAPLKQLIGRAYTLRSESTREIIEAIEAGILKEVSVGVGIGRSSCSICGKDMAFDWGSWCYECGDYHVKGETYPDGGLCWSKLEDPTDAYELSFVAVPAQRNAGVTKSASELGEAFDALLSCPDLSESPQFPKLIDLMKRSTQKAAEREERARILRENEKFLST